jgi:hypothetical protein
VPVGMLLSALWLDGWRLPPMRPQVLAGQRLATTGIPNGSEDRSWDGFTLEGDGGGAERNVPRGRACSRAAWIL